MSRRINSVAEQGLEVLSRDATAARLELIRMECNDPAIHEALYLLEDIAIASEAVRLMGLPAPLTVTRRGAANSKPGRGYCAGRSENASERL